MKMMVTSLFLLLGAVLIQARIIDRLEDCPDSLKLCIEGERFLNECQTYLDCQVGQMCCPNCGRNICYDPFIPDRFEYCPDSLKLCIEGEHFLKECQTYLDCQVGQMCCPHCGRNICYGPFKPDPDRCRHWAAIFPCDIEPHWEPLEPVAAETPE